MNVNPGEFKKSIKIISLGSTAGGNGYPVASRTTVYQCKAGFSRISGTELSKANADFSETKVRFLIRYTKTVITRKMLVEYDGKDYQIEYINDYEDRHEYIEIMASRLTTE